MDLNYEMQYKDQQINELREALSGTVRAKGDLVRTYHPDGIHEKWDVNTSSILTKLIQEAGRWCERYASDLFIQWSCNIESKLRDGSLTSSQHIFAMRESGVDHKEWYEHNKEKRDYYRAVWFLDVVVSGSKNDDIELILHK